MAGLIKIIRFIQLLISFYFYQRFKKHIFIAFILNILIVCDGFSQVIDFVPNNIFRLSYGVKSITSESMLDTGVNRKSILENRLSRRNLENNTVDGDIKYESMIQTMTIQYGLFDSFNLGLVLSYVSSERKSDLTVKTNSIDTLAFVEDYQEAKSSGLGDIQFWGIWRFIYSGELDVRMGFILDADNAPYYYGEPDKMSLGSGAQELSYFLRWKIYPRNSELIVDINVLGSTTLNSSVYDSASGEKLTLSRGRESTVSLMLSSNWAAFHYGGGFLYDSQAETVIGGANQKDGYMSYFYKMFVTYGNLSQLEKHPVTLPWLIKFHIQNAFYGLNAPDSREFGIEASLYF